MKLTLTLALIAMTLAACSPPAAEAPASAPAIAAQTPAPAAPGVSAYFMAPSGNIGCSYTPAGGTAIYETADGRAELSCDRAEPDYVRVVMSEQGAARIVATEERGCCSGETIPYGDRWVQGPFSCDVTEAGVTCASAAGYGFTLSRTRAEVR